MLKISLIENIQAYIENPYCHLHLWMGMGPYLYVQI